MPNAQSSPETAPPVSALVAKLRAARPGTNAMDRQEEQALRLSMARAGRKALDCDVLVTASNRVPVALPGDLAGPLKSMALVAGLTCQEGDQGVVAMDANAVAAITAIRTTGHLPREAVAEDAPKASSIQAALARPLVTFFLIGWHAALTGMSERTGNHELADMVADYRFGTPVAAPRTLLLAMPPGEMVSVSADIEFGGQVSGRIMLSFPVARVQEPAPPASDPLRNERETAAWGAEYRDGVMASRTHVEAVLHKARMSWDTIETWEEGSVIPLPAECLDQVILRSGTATRQMSGRLGQIHGARAVRLRDPKQPGPNPLAMPDFAEAGVGRGGAVEAARDATDMPAVEIGGLPAMGTEV